MHGHFVVRLRNLDKEEKPLRGEPRGAQIVLSPRNRPSAFPLSELIENPLWDGKAGVDDAAGEIRVEAAYLLHVAEFGTSKFQRNSDDAARLTEFRWLPIDLDLRDRIAGRQQDFDLARCAGLATHAGQIQIAA